MYFATELSKMRVIFSIAAAKRKTHLKKKINENIHDKHVQTNYDFGYKTSAN